jgi:predicted RND superfamily exporter protein
VERRSLLERLAHAVEVYIGRVALFAFERPTLVLGLTLVACALGGFSAQRLTLNTDLTALLPHTFASVRDAQHLSERFGGVGYVAVLARSNDPAALERFADEIAPKLSRLESARFVDYRRPDGFFKDHALYFMDQGDLETLRDRLETRRDWEVARATGVLIEENEPPPPVEVDDLKHKYEDRVEFGNVNENANEPGKAKRSPLAEKRYYTSEDGKELVLLVKPNRLASDLAFARKVVGDVEHVLAAENLSSFAPDLRVELTGRYKKRVDLQKVLNRDLRITSVVSFVLVLGYIIFHFRRLSALILVFVPLIVALLFTYAIAALVIGELNVLTAFIGAILLGIGVDNGLHLLARYDEERCGGKPPREAVIRAFGESGRASAAAALTNVGAFACLMIADFGAFREFGFLAASGLLLTLAACIVLMPAFLGILTRRHAIDPPPARRADWARGFIRWAPAVFWALTLGLVAIGTQIPRSVFNYDFGALDDADIGSYKLDKDVNRILGRSQTPLVVLAEDDAEGRTVANALRDRKKEAGEGSTIDRVITLADLVPQAQPAKQPLIEEIGEIARRLREDKLTPEQKRQRDDVLRMSEAHPFTRADLPDEVRRQFTTADGKELADFVLIFPAVSMSDGRVAQRVAKEVSNIPTSRGTVSAAGEPMVLADILSSMQRDLPIVLMMALAQQIVLLVALMGSVARAATTLLPVIVSIPALIGLLPVFGLELNYLNVILLPTLLGMGEDGGAHFVSRISEGEALDEALANVAPANFGAGLTTLFGFGTLLIAHHPGLQSLGRVAVLGFAVNAIACTILLPVTVEMVRRFKLVFRGRGAGATLAATVGLAGLSPRGGGTVGALLAVPAVIAIHRMSTLHRLAVAVGVSTIAFGVTAAYLRVRPGDDPQEIVVDEFAGAFVAMALIPWSPWAAFAAFWLFRAFDILKPWPVSFVERRAAGAAGVVGDDIVAGLLAAAFVGGLAALGFR